jgi:hypothetical protein
MNLMFLKMMFLEMNIFPNNISDIISSYYTCSCCAATYERIRNLLHCGYLQAHCKIVPQFIGSGAIDTYIKFYAHNNKYFISYKSGYHDTYNLHIELETFVAILTHRLSFDFTIFATSFPITQNHHPLSLFIYTEHKYDILLLIIFYQVFRCPLVLKFIQDIGFADSLQTLYNMNNISPKNCYCSIDINTLPSCPPSCPHYSNSNTKLIQYESINSILGVTTIMDVKRI